MRISSDDCADNEDKESVETIDENEEEKEEKRLAAKRLTKEDIHHVISTMSKEAKYDLISIKQLFYGMCSAISKLPQSHRINSRDSGSGKSYLMSLTGGYFSDKHVLPLAGMSDKAIIHMPGIPVIEITYVQTGDQDITPIEPIIDSLELEEDKLKDEHAKLKDDNKKNGNSSNGNKDKIKEIEGQVDEIADNIKYLRTNAEKLIDLNNMIILGLDTPQDTVFDAIMALISQDNPRDQKYSYVEKSSSGEISTRVNRLRSVPAFFVSRVVDDSRAVRFAETNRRFVPVNPDTSEDKVGAANDLIGLKLGVLPVEYDQMVVSREHKEKAKDIVRIICAKLKQHSKNLGPKEPGVKVPFVDAITKSMPKNNVWSMTVTERLMKYLAIITKVNMDCRPKIIDNETGQVYPITMFEDLKETLGLMDRAACVRPYIAKFFNDVFLAAFRELRDKPNELKDELGNLIAKERHVGLTTEQLGEKTKEVLGGLKPGSTDLLHKYLYPLINQGIIDKTQSEIDKRHKIWFPIEEDNISTLFEKEGDCRLKIKVKDRFTFPSYSVIEQSCATLLDYYYKPGGLDKKRFTLVDHDGNEITTRELIDKYFNFKAEDCFIKDWLEQEPVITNIGYSSTVLRQQLLQNYSPPPTCSINPTEIHNNPPQKTTDTKTDNKRPPTNQINDLTDSNDATCQGCGYDCGNMPGLKFHVENYHKTPLDAIIKFQWLNMGIVGMV